MPRISFRKDMFGNEPEIVFDRVEDALNHIRAKPAYEIIPDDALIRPYGDLDGRVPEGMSYQEYNDIDLQLYTCFAKYFESFGKDITLYSGSSYEYKKWSLRWVIPNCSVRTKRHAKAFAKELYEKLVLPSYIKPDLSVYSKNQKMRTLHTSKPNEDRIFYMLQGEEEDTIISNAYPEQLFEFEVDDDPVEYKPTSEYESTYITQICDIIAVEHWTSYDTCQSLIFSLLSVGSSADLIHRYCSKAKNYSHKWVQDYIARYNPKNNKHSIGTLKYFAKLSDPANYKLLKKDTKFRELSAKQAFAEITELTTDEHTLQNWCDLRGFLKPLPSGSTIAVKSHLGTGKTRQIISACKGADTIAVFSCRQTFTSHIISELTGFVDYRKCKERQIRDPKVVIQVQSVHRIRDRTFELVLLDEVETILANLSPNQTHKQYIETIQVFESVIRSAKRVICLDAFLTNRTMKFLKALRGSSVLVINPTLPYCRKADVYLNQDEFSSNIASELYSGSRIISVWGTLKSAEIFHTGLPKHISNVYYTSKTDAKQKDEHLSDVNTHWSNYQSVGYTSSITVGINYTHKLDFDIGSLYASAWGCGVRDYAQALHRARRLSKNKFMVYIDTKPYPCAVEPGYMEQERIFKEDISRTKDFLQLVNENVSDYRLLPDWLHEVMMWNRNERITGLCYFKECMEGYLELCGCTISHVGSTEDIKKKSISSQRISVNDVADISDECAEQYSLCRTTLSEQQHYELEKYYLTQKVVKMDEFIWDTWLTKRHQVERAFALFMRKPEDLIKTKVLDLVPKDCQRLKIVQDLGFDWDTEWERSVHDIPRIELDLFHIRVRSEKQSQEQYCRDFAKAMKDWCGIQLNVNQKRVRVKGDEREYTYSLKYSPDGILSYFPRKMSAANIFNDIP